MKKKPKKKKLTFDYDPKKFQNYQRVVRIFWSSDLLCDIRIRGYIHNFETTKKYVHFIIFDVENQFDPKNKLKTTWHKPAPGEFPNYIRKLHIFLGHQCIAEVDVRGFLQEFVPENTNVTIHTDHTLNHDGKSPKRKKQTSSKRGKK